MFFEPAVFRPKRLDGEGAVGDVPQQHRHPLAEGGGHSVGRQWMSRRRRDIAMFVTL